MKRTHTSLTLTLLSTLPQTHAWGSLGHQTVGFIAQKYLSPATVTWAQTILNNKNSSYLASVATWADSYRYTDAGKFSAPYHYIDANDSPPQQCDVDLARDCHSEGCVVSAITNYTARVQDSSLSADDRKVALMFLTHFFGDITQPLHDEAISVGGNQINVTFDKKPSNLHHIWDTEIPEKWVGGYSLSDASRWATQLAQEIDSGNYQSEKGGWIKSLNVSDAQGSALAMASDANGFVCTYTLKDGVDAVEHGDLGGTYYQNVLPVVKMQIAKGGYRLAAWLNLLATGKTGLK